MTEKQQSLLPGPELVRDLVTVGIEQIRVRQQELDLQEKDSQRQYEFAKQALAVQSATFLAGGLSGYGLSRTRARRENDAEDEVDLEPARS